MTDTTKLVKPAEVKMTVQAGMLESLGINMYTSIAKSLVEFVANGFDAEAKHVRLEIPFDEIESERTKMREAAKAEVKAGKRPDLKNIYDPLPEVIEIVIKDDGHGMTPEELETKFLKVNRNRRIETGSEKSENGKRTVMGRKGLGKLAGFGVAELVTVTTKRKGETFSTTISMDFRKIEIKDRIDDVAFQTRYDEGQAPDDQGTVIRLSRLRCDSLSNKGDTVYATLARNFSIAGDDFEVTINGEKIEAPKVDYEFIFPPEAEKSPDGLAEIKVDVFGVFEYPVRAAVKFRARGESPNGAERGNIPARLRGARVYCNQRLAAGPTLFNLETGMHNFHSQSYMECIVHADVLDQRESDLIGTNRSGLKTDNEVVDAFINTITELMKEALYAHSKFRDDVAETEIQKDPISKAIFATISTLPAKTRQPAKSILKTFAAREGVESPAYQELAPLLVGAINATEVLSDLIKTGIDPTSLKIIISQLTELADIERTDALKIYRGRKHAIDGLQKLQDRSFDDVRKYEDELQELLKKAPWLIQPEFGKFLTSNVSLGTVAKEITNLLQIDTAAAGVDKEKSLRPDLVFLASDPGDPSHIAIVELKSPNVILQIEHLTQLKGYILAVERYLRNAIGRHRVVGYLVGNVPGAATKDMGELQLLDEMEKSGPNAQWRVHPIPFLLERARVIHQESIDALQALDEQEVGAIKVSPSKDHLKPMQASKLKPSNEPSNVALPVGDTGDYNFDDDEYDDVEGIEKN